MQATRRKGINILGVAVVAALAVGLLLLSAPSASAQAPTTLILSVPSGTVSEDAGAVTVTATLDQPAPEKVRVAGSHDEQM